MSIERRIISQTSVRAMTDSDGSLSICGTAAPFNRYARMKGFRERILPGAFKRVLQRSAQGRKSGSDVLCLLNHDPNLVLGRMSNKTLSCEEDGNGLQFRCQLPPTTYARDLHALISRRDIAGCSFGFNCNPDGSDETWDEGYADGLGLDSEDEEDEPTRSKRRTRFVRRTIRNFSMLTDCGPVAAPAYNSTSVEARSFYLANLAIPEGCPVEFRSRIVAARGEVDAQEVKRAEALARRRHVIQQLMS